MKSFEDMNILIKAILKFFTANQLWNWTLVFSKKLEKAWRMFCALYFVIKPKNLILIQNLNPNPNLWLSTESVVFTASLLVVQQSKGSVKPPTCVVDRWAGGSLTQRPKGLFAVSWPMQLGEFPPAY